MHVIQSNVRGYYMINAEIIAILDHAAFRQINETWLSWHPLKIGFWSINVSKIDHSAASHFIPHT